MKPGWNFGSIELAFARVPVPAPANDEVLIRLEAAPINPSDIGLLLPGFDLHGAVWSGAGESTRVVVPLWPGALQSLRARVGKSLAVGNEGAGVVVAAGRSAHAQRLIGKRVAARAGGTFAEYRCAGADDCIVLPPGTSAADGAACFVNPMTVLCMVETMRREGHRAIVHTAAASNLGQMLVKLCLRETIGLVNVVRRPEQADLLRSLGAVHVCDSSSPAFERQLVEAIAATGATLAFDAIGGGSLASQILNCMERATVASEAPYSRYGSTGHKQVYLYGSLDPGDVAIRRDFGMAWGIGGWLRSMAWEKLSAEQREDMRRRVSAELKTTFASSYSNVVPLPMLLAPAVIAGFCKRATGEKYLVVPHR